ncbi:hypothetical protein JAAARDRAFT_59562 [Jaapia argillacea MUCL 33604]|uniref:Uncharacterized protein n=1 Tax=Jaapia argillacea MUCL 33604 TaxID=933084 RepID=A0A067PY28_9AGAM|nr:hypothetical protein JAAARDRAFT_59562 [Jaapia argillacea MUCL 33604]
MQRTLKIRAKFNSRPSISSSKSRHRPRGCNIRVHGQMDSRATTTTIHLGALTYLVSTKFIASRFQIRASINLY